MAPCRETRRYIKNHVEGEIMDISLNYFGGSGGFYALWHILLGTNYRCVFDIVTSEDINKKYNVLRGSDWPEKLNDASEENVDADLWPAVKMLKEAKIWELKPDNLCVYTNHWNIEKKQEWKKTEIWPDNETTASLKCDKVFFYCNPTLEDWEANKNNFRIFLYTDIELQWLLAKNKRAWAFVNPTRDFNKMANHVKFLNSNVYYQIPEYKEGDLYIKLQDIVKTNGGAILEPLGHSVTQRNIDHNTMWLNLHNEEERKLLIV